MEDPEYRRLGDTAERMIAAASAGDAAAFQTMLESFTIRETRMIMFGWAMLITQYRSDLGHPPDATYGPEK